MENNDAKIFEYKSESNLPNRKLIRERLPPTETKISFDEQSSLSELNLCMDDVKPEVNGNSVAEVCDIEKTKLTSKRVAFRSQSLRSTASDCHPGLLLQKKNLLLRDTSFQSDSSSSRSVESLLEERKPDAEAILQNLGFGRAEQEHDDILSKIPKRFLVPSKCVGIDTFAFMRHQHSTCLLGGTRCIP